MGTSCFSYQFSDSYLSTVTPRLGHRICQLFMFQRCSCQRAATCLQLFMFQRCSRQRAAAFFSYLVSAVFTPTNGLMPSVIYVSVVFTPTNGHMPYAAEFVIFSLEDWMAKTQPNGTFRSKTNRACPLGVQCLRLCFSFES